MEEIILEFQNITKYPLLDFLSKYRDFLINSYPLIDEYFSGRTEEIKNNHFSDLELLTKECKEILSLFNNSSKKLNKCGFWELMDFICDLNETIEKINKLYKFRKTSKTKRGYKPYVQVQTNIGGMRTVEDVAYSVNSIKNNDASWVELMLNNDLNEDSWEIDELKPINALVNNQTQIVVSTILDQPIGERIYGIDISRNIQFEDNDLKVEKYEENISQKCDILLGLKQGDIPENIGMGVNSQLFNGTSVKKMLISKLLSEINESFMQNDLFESINPTDITFENGDMNVRFDIKTKYDYKTSKQIAI